MMACDEVIVGYEIQQSLVESFFIKDFRQNSRDYMDPGNQEELPQQLNEETAMVDCSDALNEADHQPNESEEKPNEQANEMDEYGDELNEYGDELNEYGDELNEYGDELNEYGDEYAYEAYEDGQDLEKEINKEKELQNGHIDQSGIIKRILEETESIDKYTMFGADWSLAYYAACGWSISLCQELIDTENTHKKLIHYTDQFVHAQGIVDVGVCLLCLEEGLLIRSYCGDVFCEKCWTRHLLERYKRYWNDPFPQCINEDCLIRASPKLCFDLSKENPDLQKLFLSVLCRSYTTYNNSVRACKGRPRKSCSQIFTINNLFDIIQCGECGNLVCPKCGQQAHGNSYCFQSKTWTKLTIDSIEFMEMYNYRACPNCKEAVERISGCSEIVCLCRQKFCYICGQNWLPNHNSQEDFSCYRFREIQAFNKERKIKRKNAKGFFFKIEGYKNRINTFSFKASLADTFREQLPKIDPILRENYPLYENDLKLLKEICDLLIRVYSYLKGWCISLYFRPDQLQSMQCDILIDIASRIYNYIFIDVCSQLYSHGYWFDGASLDKKNKRPEEMRNDNFFQAFTEFKRNSNNLIERASNLMRYE